MKIIREIFDEPSPILWTVAFIGEIIGGYLFATFAQYFYDKPVSDTNRQTANLIWKLKNISKIQFALLMIRNLSRDLAKVEKSAIPTITLLNQSIRLSKTGAVFQCIL